MIDLESILVANSAIPRLLEPRREYKFSEVRICPVCKGTGSITETSCMGHVRGLEDEVHTCDFCNGTGRVDMCVDISLKPFR